MTSRVAQCLFWALLAVSGPGVHQAIHGDDRHTDNATTADRNEESSTSQDLTIEAFRIDGRRPWDATKWADFARSRSASQLRGLKHGESITFRCLAAWALLLRDQEPRRVSIADSDEGIAIADRAALRQFCGFVEGAIRAELPQWWIRAAETGEIYRDGSLRFRIEETFHARQDDSVDSQTPWSLATAARYKPDGIQFSFGGDTFSVATPDGERIRNFFESVHCCRNGDAACLVFFGNAPTIEVMKIKVSTGAVIDTASLSISPIPGFSGYDTTRASIVGEDGRFIVFAGCSDGLSIFSFGSEDEGKLSLVPYGLLWEVRESEE
jgi:hypothetical protein